MTAPYFLATKIEAFKGRGRGDFLASHDLEDLIFVIDGRPTIVEEVQTETPLLRRYLHTVIAGSLAAPGFIDQDSSCESSPTCEDGKSPIILFLSQAFRFGGLMHLWGTQAVSGRSIVLTLATRNGSTRVLHGKLRSRSSGKTGDSRSVIPRRAR